MKVKNWMLRQPPSVSSDTLVSEAKRLLSEHNLHALPVVDGERLRGLVTRAHCLRAAHFVSKTQNADEFEYFSSRLKVKDIMVRNPATVDVDTTMEQCLELGRAMRAGQFPVVDGERVVGLITANEIFNLAAHFLGAWERRSGVTLAPMPIGPGVIGKVVDVIEAAGATVFAVYPLSGATRLRDAAGGSTQRKLIVRFHGSDVGTVVAALEAASFQVLEHVDGGALH